MFRSFSMEGKLSKNLPPVKQRETKENVQGTKSDGKETGTHINGVDQKEGRKMSNQKRMKKQEFKKMRRGLGTSRTS